MMYVHCVSKNGSSILNLEPFAQMFSFVFCDLYYIRNKIEMNAFIDRQRLNVKKNKKKKLCDRGKVYRFRATIVLKMPIGTSISLPLLRRRLGSADSETEAFAESPRRASTPLLAGNTVLENNSQADLSSSLEYYYARCEIHGVVPNGAASLPSNEIEYGLHR